MADGGGYGHCALGVLDCVMSNAYNASDSLCPCRELCAQSKCAALAPYVLSGSMLGSPCDLDTRCQGDVVSLRRAVPGPSWSPGSLGRAVTSLRRMNMIYSGLLVSSISHSRSPRTSAFNLNPHIYSTSVLAQTTTEYVPLSYQPPTDCLPHTPTQYSRCPQSSDLPARCRTTKGI